MASFDVIITDAIDRGLCESTASGFEVQNHTCMEREVFVDYINNTYVEADAILRNPRKYLISEENIIPEDRDVGSVCHLPYVDDKMHVHNHFEIDYVYQGHARLCTESEEKEIKEGEIYILSPDMAHNVQVEDDDSIVIGIMVRKSTFDNIFGLFLTQNTLLGDYFRNIIYYSKKAPYLVFHVKNRDVIINKLIQDIFIETKSDKKYSNELANCYVQQMFFQLMRNYSDTIYYLNSQNIANDQAEFMMVLEYTQKHFSTITLGELAEFFHYSESHLSRMFKKNLGTNFVAIIKRLKLEKVEELIRSTDESIARISEIAGYDSPDYMTRAFKKKYNMTPSEYRRHVIENER